MSRSDALIRGLERAEVSRLLLIEEGCARDIRRRLPAGVDLNVPACVSMDPDLLFVRATNWLLCESGCDWSPNLAAETRGPNDSAARVALAKLVRGDQDIAVHRILLVDDNGSCRPPGRASVRANRGPMANVARADRVVGLSTNAEAMNWSVEQRVVPDEKLRSQVSLH